MSEYEVSTQAQSDWSCVLTRFAEFLDEGFFDEPDTDKAQALFDSICEQDGLTVIVDEDELSIIETVLESMYINNMEHIESLGYGWDHSDPGLWDLVQSLGREAEIGAYALKSVSLVLT